MDKNALKELINDVQKCIEDETLTEKRISDFIDTLDNQSIRYDLNKYPLLANKLNFESKSKLYIFS